MNIVHWGAGKLGLSLAVWNAHCGHNVTCVDVNGDTVRAINAGRSPIDEPWVQGLLDLQSSYYGYANPICATLGGKDPVEKGVVEDADIIFIIVPTPSLENGAFDLSYVEESCRVIGRALRQKDGHTLIVCVSTIMPGDSRKLIKAIEEASGKKCGESWGFCYSPEFVRQGSIVHDYANPDVLLIGASDIVASVMLQTFYESVIQNAPGIFHLSLESAEIAKIGLNAAVVTKIAVANQLAWLCHHTPGANAEHVLNAIGDDPRIGHKYFDAGLWPGGPCFPRDSRALVRAGASRDLHLLIAAATDEFHEFQASWLAEEVLHWLDDIDGNTVGLLGLTYKPDASLLDESQALRLHEKLKALDHHVVVLAYDPDVAVGMSIQTMHELVEQSDVIVLMTPKPQFLHLERMDLSGKILFDCWGYIGETNADKHIVLGVGE